MKQIRKGVFETNSSSTHSICISKAPVKRLPERIVFHAGEYGWGKDCVDTADYLFTGILDGPANLRESRLCKLESLLDELGVECVFHYPEYNEKYDSYDCYVDHSYELGDFIEAVLSDKDLLARCLFGDSCVYTGNDNQVADPAGCNIAEEYSWGIFGGKYQEFPNPYHDEEHYDYFYKGN